VTIGGGGSVSGWQDKDEDREHFKFGFNKPIQHEDLNLKDGNGKRYD
jgi:hypothetical protein